MKSIMIDMDDVMICGLFQSIIEKFLGKKLDINDNTGYFLQDFLEDKKDEFFSWYKSVNIYENASLAKGCYDALKTLSKKYKIYIVTDFITPEVEEYAGNVLKNKYEYLYQHLDFLDAKSFVFAADKSIISCDIKIDDKIENLHGAETKLLFSAYHNNKYSDAELNKEGVVRVHNWDEILNILLDS